MTVPRRVPEFVPPSLCAFVPDPSHHPEPRGVETRGADEKGVVLVLVLVLMPVPSSADCRNLAVIQQMVSQAANLASKMSVPIEAVVGESLMNLKPPNGRANGSLVTAQLQRSAAQCSGGSGGRVGWQRPIGHPRPKMAHVKGSRASPPPPRLVFSLGGLHNRLTMPRLHS